MINYKPFKKLLIDRELKNRDVMEMANISRATIAKMILKLPVLQNSFNTAGREFHDEVHIPGKMIAELRSVPCHGT